MGVDRALCKKRVASGGQLAAFICNNVVMAIISDGEGRWQRKNGRGGMACAEIFDVTGILAWPADNEKLAKTKIVA